MTSEPSAYVSSPSTAWEWRFVRIRRRSAAERTAAEGRPPGRLPLWNRREPLHIQVRYWGGPECRIRVKARGRTFYFSGHDAIYDVMRVIWGEA
jgi:hypothetical protein